MGGHWPYKCTLVVPHHWSKGGSLAPAPAELVEACGASRECVEHFPLSQNLFIVSFLSTSSACCVHSFAVLCFLVSAFPTSVAGVWRKWRLFAFSTGFGAPVATCPCTTCPCTRLWFLPLLGLGGFSILDIIHLCSLLHSVQMMLHGDFPAWLYPITRCLVSLYVLLSQSLPWSCHLASPLMIVSLSTWFFSITCITSLCD